MNDDKSETQAKILARALYEVRLLLSGYLGSQTVADINVRQAAHLAYAFITKRSQSLRIAPLIQLRLSVG